MAIKFRQARSAFIAWSNSCEDGQQRFGRDAKSEMQAAFERVEAEAKTGRKFTKPKQMFIDVTAYYEEYGATPAEHGLETSWEERCQRAAELHSKGKVGYRCGACVQAGRHS